MTRVVARLAVAVAVGTAVGASVFASASGPGMTPSGVGMGSGLAGTCDRDGVGTAFVTGFVPATGYAVTQVRVSGIDAACTGRSVRVVLTDDAGRRIGEGEPITIDAASVSVPVGGSAGASSIARVHAVIT